MNPVDVLAAMSGTPKLHGAACRGRPEVFDLNEHSDPELIERAKLVCGSCPALPACREWVDGLPAHLRPSGVVAGRLLSASTRSTTARPPVDAGVWLAGFLADRGPTRPADVIAAARAVGIGEHRLRAAARALPVRLTGPKHGRSSTWAPPGDEREAAG
jgi:hypothetical protein